MRSQTDDATASSSVDAFRSELQRLRGTQDPHPPHRSVRSGHDDRADRADGIEMGPLSVYEAVTRQMVESLADDIREIKNRLTSLVFMLIGGILLEIAIRLIGPLVVPLVVPLVTS